MAENVVPAVVGEVVGTAASFIKNKFHELSGVSDKVEELEWKVLKIKSAIEESKKYDIDNESLREMQQKFVTVAQEGEDALRKYKNQSTGPDPQSSVQGAVMPSNSTNISLVWKMLIYGIVGLPFTAYPHRLADELTKQINMGWYVIFIFSISRRVNLAASEVPEFLEMVRHQKRSRKRRCRAYKLFFKLVLGYCRAQVSPMRSLFQGMSSPVYRDSKLKCADRNPLLFFSEKQSLLFRSDGWDRLSHRSQSTSVFVAMISTYFGVSQQSDQEKHCLLFFLEKQVIPIRSVLVPAYPESPKS